MRASPGLKKKDYRLQLQVWICNYTFRSIITQSFNDKIKKYKPFAGSLKSKQNVPGKIKRKLSTTDYSPTSCLTLTAFFIFVRTHNVPVQLQITANIIRLNCDLVYSLYDCLTAYPCNPVRLLFSEIVTSFDLGNKGAQMRRAASAARSSRSKTGVWVCFQTSMRSAHCQQLPFHTLHGPPQTPSHWWKRSLWFRRGWDRQHPLAHCELNRSLPSSARTLCQGAGRLKIVCTHVCLHHL